MSPYLPEQTLFVGLLDEYRAGWYSPEHWHQLARLAGVSTTYLTTAIAQLLEKAQTRSSALQKQLRQRLSEQELDFLSERVNPVIQTRRSYLQEAIKGLQKTPP